MLKIAFVCDGNTCRSPMCECIFKSFLKQTQNKSVNVSSYGISAIANTPMNENAKQVLKKYKISGTHKAKKLTDKVLKSKDYVFVMTETQRNILRKYNNVFSLKEFVDGIDIPDPYGLGLEEYEIVFKLLYSSLKRVYRKLVGEIIWK